MLLLAEVSINTPDYATGGGLVVFAAILLPLAKLIIEWRKEAQIKNIAWEERKRLEDAATKLEQTNLFKEMVVAITKGAMHAEDVDDSLKQLTEKIQIIHDRLVRRGLDSSINLDPAEVDQKMRQQPT